MTSYSFGDVVIVPVTFSDQSEIKKRPAVVVSSAAYHQGRTDLILMAITSQVRPSGRIGEIPVSGWREAGLLKPSVFKPLLFTLDRALFLRRLGRLEETDRRSLRRVLAEILEITT
jgi:mRNA-degrading endonuclease toxin of MazEF toxin-antitoxin module